MIYCCSNCRYVFEEDAEPGYCPDCGKTISVTRPGRKYRNILNTRRSSIRKK